MRLLRWLFSSCLFGHQPLVKEYDGERLWLVCPRCRSARVVLREVPHAEA